MPFVYYGDEIGMRYQADMPTKEGGYTRTGTRTPMQWDKSENLGFSTAAADQLYLPVDPAPDAPTVEAQEGDPDSMLETVRAIIAFRHGHEDLGPDTDFEPIEIPGEPHALVYRRGNLYLCVNPSGKTVTLPEDIVMKMKGLHCLFAIGIQKTEAKKEQMNGQSFLVFGRG